MQHFRVSYLKMLSHAAGNEASLMYTDCAEMLEYERPIFQKVFPNNISISRNWVLQAISGDTWLGVILEKI